jgi:signal transduction histidine kinase
VNNSLDSLRAKAEEREGGKMNLALSSQVHNAEGKQWAEVSVYDTGEGIKKSDLKNIFKPFFTTKRPGEGTGLGLTICRQLAHKYGGMLEIDSKEGAWTRVTLRIPYQATSL